MTAEEQKMVDMLVQTNHELAAQVKELSAQLAWFQRQMFGRRSEKLPLMDPNQLSLFDEPIAPEVVQAQEEATEQIKKETPEDKKQQRRNRKMMEGLPVLERIVLKPEEVDNTYRKIGEEVTRVVKFIPGKLGVIEYVREKYAKNIGDNTDIRIAPMPLFPINKGIPFSIMSRRSVSVKEGFLSRFADTSTITLSKSLEARLIISRCP